MTATDPQMRLLIIEDDRESADYLAKAFREVGYVADLAGDGEEGLALAEGGRASRWVARTMDCARSMRRNKCIARFRNTFKFILFGYVT